MINSELLIKFSLLKFNITWNFKKLNARVCWDYNATHARTKVLTQRSHERIFRIQKIKSIVVYESTRDMVENPKKKLFSGYMISKTIKVPETDRCTIFSKQGTFKFGNRGGFEGWWWKQIPPTDGSIICINYILLQVHYAGKAHF